LGRRFRVCSVFRKKHKKPETALKLRSAGRVLEPSSENSCIGGMRFSSVTVLASRAWVPFAFLDGNTPRGLQSRGFGRPRSPGPFHGYAVLPGRVRSGTSFFARIGPWATRTSGRGPGLDSGRLGSMAGPRECLVSRFDICRHALFREYWEVYVSRPRPGRTRGELIGRNERFDSWTGRAREIEGRRSFRLIQHAECFAIELGRRLS